jgi:hypothetical protein
MDVDIRIPCRIETYVLHDIEHSTSPCRVLSAAITLSSPWGADAKSFSAWKSDAVEANCGGRSVYSYVE